MTLDFKRLITNQIQDQMDIQHFQCKAQLFRRDELRPGWKVVRKITEKYGQNALLDADWLLFFAGRNIDSSMLKENGALFKIANAALGRAANSMAEGDFKLVDMDEKRPQNAPESADDQIERLVGGDDTDDSGTVRSDPNAEAVADVLNESVESPEQGEKFAFIKITIK